MWTISINSAINDGQNAHYDESCSSTLASTFSNGAKDPNTGVVIIVNSIKVSIGVINKGRPVTLDLFPYSMSHPILMRLINGSRERRHGGHPG